MSMTTEQKRKHLVKASVLRIFFWLIAFAGGAAFVVLIMQFTLSALLTSQSKALLSAACEKIRVASGECEVRDGTIYKIKINALYLDSSPLSDVDGIDEVRELDFSREDVSGKSDNIDSHLKHLSKLPEVNILKLRYCSLTNVGLEQIRVLQKLHDLNLSNTFVDDTGCLSIGKMSSLKKLDISCCPVSDEGLEFLQGLELTSFSARSCNITSTGLKHLKMGCIQRLDLSYTRIEEFLLPGENFVNLKWLSVRDCRVTDKSIANLGLLPALEALQLGETDLSIDAISSLKSKRPGLIITWAPRSPTQTKEKL